MHPDGPVVRVEEAALGPDAQVRLVVSGVSDPKRLRGPWASSGATVELVGGRLRATSTAQALARAAGRSLPRDEAAALEQMLRDAVSSWMGRDADLRVPGGLLATGARPLVMGVVNVTPDSFSDGGALYGPDAGAHPEVAIAYARRLLAGGADLLDIGGESARPGAEPVSEAEELERVLPVVTELAGAGAPISIDSTKPGVARAAVEAGAVIVNDVSGAADPDLLEVVADTGAAYVLMHTRGTPKTMQEQAQYTDVVAEVYEFLAAGLQRCGEAGIAADRVAVDPGIGFAKHGEHNLVLLQSLRQFRGLGCPVLVGASRKSFLGGLLDGAAADDRLEGSLACATVATLAGAGIVRVHDVAATARTVRVAHAIAAGADDWVADVFQPGDTQEPA